MFSEEDQDLYALIFTGPIILMSLIGGGIGGWIMTQGQVATSWLTQHHLLVPADQALVPILDAGLDLPRCVLLATLLILMLWLAISGARRQRAGRA